MIRKWENMRKYGKGKAREEYGTKVLENKKAVGKKREKKSNMKRKTRKYNEEKY